MVETGVVLQFDLAVTARAALIWITGNSGTVVFVSAVTPLTTIMIPLFMHSIDSLA